MFCAFATTDLLIDEAVGFERREYIEVVVVLVLVDFGGVTSSLFDSSRFVIIEGGSTDVAAAAPNPLLLLGLTVATEEESKYVDFIRLP